MLTTEKTFARYMETLYYFHRKSKSSGNLKLFLKIKFIKREKGITSLLYRNLGSVRLSHPSSHTSNDLHLLGNQSNAGLNLWNETGEMNTVGINSIQIKSRFCSCDLFLDDSFLVPILMLF